MYIAVQKQIPQKYEVVSYFTVAQYPFQLQTSCLFSLRINYPRLQHKNGNRIVFIYITNKYPKR